MESSSIRDNSRCHLDMKLTSAEHFSLAFFFSEFSDVAPISVSSFLLLHLWHQSSKLFLILVALSLPCLHFLPPLPMPLSPDSQRLFSLLGVGSFLLVSDSAFFSSLLFPHVLSLPLACAYRDSVCRAASARLS